MSGILDAFFILFESDTSKLDAGLSESERKSQTFLDKLKDVDKQASKTGTNFRDMVGKLAAFAGVGLTLGALVAGVRDVAREYVDLEKLALQFRATVDEVDEFIDAAGLLSISEDKATESLHGLERAVQDTAMGMGRAQKVFEELGIKVEDGTGKLKSTTAVMTELAGKFEGMDRGKQIRIMERLGLDPALLKLFNSDLAALQRRMTEVDRASGFNLQTAVKRAQEFTKASKAMGLELNTLRMYLGKITEAFQVASLPWFTAAINTATEYVGKFVAFLMRHGHFVRGFMIAAGAAITYFLLPAAIKGALAVWAMIAPFALIAAAGLAIATVFALLYDDIANYLEGNDSLLGQMLEKFPGLAAALKFLGDTARAVWDLLLGLFHLDASGFPSPPTELWERFLTAMKAGTDALFAAFPALREVFDTFAYGFEEAGKRVLSVWDAIVAAVRLAVGVLTAGVEAVTGIVGKVKGALGLGSSPVSADVARGQAALGAASSSPLASVTSSSISNSAMRGGDRSVKVEKVEVHTQATDADGISRSIGQSLGTQLRSAANHFDDGVAA